MDEVWNAEGAARAEERAQVNRELIVHARELCETAGAVSGGSAPDGGIAQSCWS